jgi:uncharacterized protein (TIGR00730 family)
MPVEISNEKLTSRHELHNGSVQRAAEPPEQLVARSRRFPLERKTSERPWCADRTRDLPPRAQRNGVEERVEDGSRRSVDSEAVPALSHGCGLAIAVLSLDNRGMQPLAYLNPEFLESEEARPLRILAEYLEPLSRFKAQNIQDTVVFFGSARIHSRERAEQALERLMHRMAGGKADSDDRLLRGRKALEWSRYYEDARELARLLTLWSVSLGSTHHRFVVTSGGGSGIMEAANRGAMEAGGKTMGLNIKLPFEQGANRYITEGLHFEFHYFFMRKFWFAYLAKALVIFPGGFGTLDEMFEILTLVQTDKLLKPIQVILYGSEYWDEILNLQPLVEWGAIAPQDIKLLQRADTPQDAFGLLKAHLSEHHLAPATAQEMKAPGIAKTRS